MGIRPTSLVLTIALCAPFFAQAEIYIYRGKNGERMISDRPMPAQDRDYELLGQRDSLTDAGHVLANRKIDIGGPREFRAYIRAAGDKYDVDTDLIEAVIQIESGFDPMAVSSKGASGLMQLMSATAKRYQVYDRFDPRQNIDGGVRHLRHLIERFEGRLPLVLAAYNAGAGAVERYQGIPPYPETRRYVDKVMGYRARIRSGYRLSQTRY